MIVSRDLFKDRRIIGWFIYRSSDMGGTMFITALRGNEDVVKQFAQNWHDHKAAIRNLAIAWVDELELERWEYPTEEVQDVPGFHVDFNEIVYPGDNDHDPSIIGWYGIDGRAIRFTGLRQYRDSVEDLVEKLGFQNGVREGFVAWADEIEVENWYTPYEEMEDEF